ncbi:hypothetical protein ACLB2K_045054 [Fragaria x ananassa]
MFWPNMEAVIALCRSKSHITIASWVALLTLLMQTDSGRILPQIPCKKWTCEFGTTILTAPCFGFVQGIALLLLAVHAILNSRESTKLRFLDCIRLVMGSVGSSSPPKTWIPYMNSRDCSQGFCSLYCPQWCYIIIPPPPSFDFRQDNSSSSPSFSPLVIAIIGILVSAFLLVSYYTIMSKYCGNEDRRRSRIREDHGHNEELEGTQNPSIHEPWYVVTVGLDEALIKSLRVCKYKNGDVLVEGTDCAVCLSEFEEDESLRLLPKCNHAFHLPCIDTWLKSHSNCPLCRASVVSTNAPTHHQVPPSVTEPPSSNSNEEVIMRAQVSESDHSQNVEIVHGDVIPKTPLRVFSDLGNSEERDTVIEIGEPMRHVAMKRSFSGGRLFLTRPARARHTPIPL